MSGYTKLFSSIVTSTIWQETNETRIIWVTMLAMADQNGFVGGTLPGLAHMARVTVADVERGLRKLMEPDRYSRSKDNDGRRVEEVDGGWLILNHAKYRADTGVASAPAEPKKGKIYFIECGGSIRIGFSQNPWARLSALRSVMPDTPTLLGYMPGVLEDEKRLHEQFGSYRSTGDWFQDCPAIRSYLATNCTTGSDGRATGSTTAGHGRSYNTEAEAEAEGSTSVAGAPEVDGPGKPDPDFIQDGLTAGDLQAAEAESGAVAASGGRLATQTCPTSRSLAGAALPHVIGAVQDSFGLKSEDDMPGKDFPWKQVMGALARHCPSLKSPVNGDRRDYEMKRFWRSRGKTVSCFELLAQKVQASDYIMARNGHVGNAGRPYSWGWIFSKNGRGRIRADCIMDGEYSTESMAFVLTKNAKAKLTKVWIVGAYEASEVNLAEEHNGEPRYQVDGTHLASGLPEVRDYK